MNAALIRSILQSSRPVVPPSPVLLCNTGSPVLQWTEGRGWCMLRCSGVCALRRAETNPHRTYGKRSQSINHTRFGNSYRG